MNIDPEYFIDLEAKNNVSIDITKKEVAWAVEYHTIALNKLKD